ncbi:glycosyltransferase [Butyrivibrio sp. VCB2006]|uniref:glycosyltransferase n=1 Tax=Butyrivibrio sp. VCB2006 TaxID=1280679 RepID=UPI000492E0F4|nr:glycosyltransferase [Butyrivibrio sp. VCB2006]
MNNDVKISIVTPCYNSSKTIRDTLDSVEKQHYDNMEHIIIDGLSTEGTLDIVNEYKNRVQYPVTLSVDAFIRSVI